MQRLVFEDPYVHVTVDLELRLVRYTRTDARFESIEQVRSTHEGFIEAVRNCQDYRCIVDTRRAPPRNDEAFERAIGETIEALITSFSGIAFIVQSAVGRLQTQRMARANAVSAPIVCATEAEALRHLGIG